MKILEAGIKSFKWQGGTLEQVLAECAKYDIIRTVYAWGHRDGVDLAHEQDIADFVVPVGSWDNFDAQCFASFVRGVQAGIDNYEHDKQWDKRHGWSDN